MSCVRVREIENGRLGRVLRPHTHSLLQHKVILVLSLSFNLILFECLVYDYDLLLDVRCELCANFAVRE